MNITQKCILTPIPRELYLTLDYFCHLLGNKNTKHLEIKPLDGTSMLLKMDYLMRFRNLCLTLASLTFFSFCFIPLAHLGLVNREIDISLFGTYCNTPKQILT